MSKAIIQIIIDSSDLEQTIQHINKRWLNYSYKIVEDVISKNDLEIIEFLLTLFDTEKIEDKTRVRESVIERQIFCYFAYKYTTISYSKIGMYCRNLDHASVIYGIKKTKELSNIYPHFKNKVEAIESIIAFEKLKAKR